MSGSRNPRLEKYKEACGKAEALTYAHYNAQLTAEGLDTLISHQPGRRAQAGFREAYQRITASERSPH